jgi:hypothetical protein
LLASFIGVVAAVFYYVEWRDKPAATGIAIGENASQSASAPATPDQRTPPGGVVDRVVIAIKRHPRDAKGITFLVGFLLVGYFVGLQDADYIALLIFIGVVAAVFYYVEWREKPSATDTALSESAGQSAAPPAAPDQRTPPGGVVDRVVIAIKRHPRDAKGITFLVGFLLVGYLVGLQDADYIALLIFIGVVAAVFYYVEWREKPSATDTALSESAGQSAAPPAAPDQRTPPGGVVDRELASRVIPRC